jgi:hypothetical protein
MKHLTRPVSCATVDLESRHHPSSLACQASRESPQNSSLTPTSSPHILSTVSYNPKVIPNYMENALIPGEPRGIAQPF